MPDAPAPDTAPRHSRLHPLGDKFDQREFGARDRDRILYSSAFRRLAGVTQVVGTYEGHVFHNRLTHTLEVAQIARRLAEKLLDEKPGLAERMGGLDPEVVEAAALAHDLGHPPFGHIAEDELNHLAVGCGLADGFEGNAQSFRILTRLSAHREEYPGLNLSRATLNAVLKYPWFREEGKRSKKYGAYRSEEREFHFAREAMDPGSKRKSLEAAIMDHADAVAYSVHDFEDFYRAGLVPVERLRYNSHEFHTVLSDWKAAEPERAAEIDKARSVLLTLLDSLLVIEEGYTGTFKQRAALKTASSSLIRDFVFAAEMQEPESPEAELVRVAPMAQIRMDFLQRLVKVYVIRNPRLATQQKGQRTVIRTLFQIYLDAVRVRDRNLVPPRFGEMLEELPPPRQIVPGENPLPEETRLAVDIVAGFGDEQAVTMYRRLTGIAPGSVMDVLHG